MFMAATMIALMLLHVSFVHAESLAITGSVKARVLFRGPVPPPTIIEIDRDPETCGTTAAIQSLLVHPSSGGLKNAIDWGCRPYGESVWTGKPAAVAGAPITDLVSNYGNHHWSSGIAETDHIETGQQRMAQPHPGVRHERVQEREAPARHDERDGGELHRSHHDPRLLRVLAEHQRALGPAGCRDSGGAWAGICAAIATRAPGDVRPLRPHAAVRTDGSLGDGH